MARIAVVCVFFFKFIFKGRHTNGILMREFMWMSIRDMWKRFGKGQAPKSSESGRTGFTTQLATTTSTTTTTTTASRPFFQFQDSIGFDSLISTLIPFAGSLNRSRDPSNICPSFQFQLTHGSHPFSRFQRRPNSYYPPPHGFRSHPPQS
jgi:hypothetical protein